MRRSVFLAAVSAFVSSAVVSLSGSASAASFANQVVSYTPGTGAGAFNNPTAALGAPDGLTGENPAAFNYYGYPNVLSPFSPASQDDEIVAVGEGGSLTLRLERFVNVAAGLEFGVIENVSFFNPDFSVNGTTNPALTFGDDSALVEVSKDGVNFVGLTGGAATNALFNIPANYYVNAGPLDPTAPTSPVLADLGKPFTGTLASFDGKTSYADIIAAFDGSAGGTWLDASASGLDQIGYIRFSVPDDNNPATVNTLEVDSILTNASQLGGLVPEPAVAGVMMIAVSMIRRRR